jgi:hypothetical protein
MHFYFIGRPDGIGNRLEQLINIQEYCNANNLKCIYIWRNCSLRTYDPLISFENIEIRTEIKETEKNIYPLEKCMQRTFGNIVKYQFNFEIKDIDYDVIIHIRATDRIQKNIGHTDFSTEKMLNSYIEKTINFINSNGSISTYAIVSDDNKYKNYMKNKIHSKYKYVELSYNYNISKDWIDFYYLTRPNKFVIMCSQFSSYSICASILGNKKLVVFKNSLNSNLPRYKANISVID